MQKYLDKYQDRFLLLKPFLKMISEGKFFTGIFSLFLRILAVITLLGFLFITFKLWQGVASGFDVKLFFASFFIQLILIVLVFMVLNILLIRANDIYTLPLATDYIVIPIFVIVAKMLGEIMAVFYALMGIAAGLAIWIVGSLPMQAPGMSAISGGTGFAGGAMAILGGPILGFICLSIFYFIAEQIGVFVDIARNTRK